MDKPVIIGGKSCTVPEGGFFVMGDKADNFLDSRCRISSGLRSALKLLPGAAPDLRF